MESFRGDYLGPVKGMYRGRLGTWKYTIEGKPGAANESVLQRAGSADRTGAYTVVLYLHDGEGEGSHLAVERVQASSPRNAVAAAIDQRFDRYGEVWDVAVFEGHLIDQSPYAVGAFTHVFGEEE